MMMMRDIVIFLMMMMIKINGDFTAFLPLSSLMVLEPIENILTFDLAIETELRRDLLNLVSGRSSKTGSEQVSQYLQLLHRRVPPPALSPRPSSSSSVVATYATNFQGERHFQI